MTWVEDEALYEAVLQFENDQAHADGILCMRYRFAEPLVDKDIDDKISVPKATSYKDTWAVNLFEQWRHERNAGVLSNM